MDLKIVNVADMIQPAVDEIKKRTNTPELQITTLPRLNDILWGMRKRKLTTIGARTSQGKSTFAVQLCLDLAMQGKKVMFFSLEMENIECAERLLAHCLEIHNNALARGDGYKLVERAKELEVKLKDKYFLISDCIGRTWKEINDLIESWHTAGSVPDMIVLDYIQNVKGQGNQKEVFDEYIRKFREMAIRYNFAGVICSQVNRTSQESEDKSPQLHQLKGTGGLEEASDVVLLLHWPYFYHRDEEKFNHYEVYVAKNKLGATGRLNIRYEPEFFRFRDI